MSSNGNNNQRFESVSEIQSLLSQEWYNCLKNEFANNYWQNILKRLNGSKNWLPKKKDIFNALNMCPPQSVKVVILGQDPYIRNDQAHGFSFSVQPGTRPPPSLENIFKELSSEYSLGAKRPTNGCLIKWAQDGVLLLNSVLTVDEGKSDSHAKIGWENFTSAVIRYIDNHNKCVFLSWGNKAKAITDQQVVNNKVLIAGHPSPMNTARPFYGCGCFKECNDILKSMDILPVRWLSIYDDV